MPVAVATRQLRGLTTEHHRILRAVAALCIVMAFGTFGLMIIEAEWGFWKSLYFTLITITTVGYGDEGLSDQGKGFTLILLGFGIATASYAFAQVAQAAVGYQLDWRRRMQKEIDQLRNHYIVCGVGRVGRTVCARLVDASKSFVLIEKDPDHIEWARSHGYLAIQGSASEDEKLLQAGIDRARAIVCAVDSDSENIVITLSARELNPDILIVSRADAESAIRKIKRAGASHVVSPSLRGGEDIADALLRPNLSKFLDRSHQSESGYELGEVTIKAGSPLVGQTMHEYSAKEQSVVFVAVKRGDGITKVRPFAQQAFQPGDVVIVAGGPDAVSRMSQDARAAPVLS